MGADQNLDWNRLAASALDWWRDAGVDVLVEDAPHEWLAPPAVVTPTTLPGSPVRERASAPAVPARMPATIEAFLTWRISGAAPEAEWSGGMIPASGPADADLMILLDCPERDDRDALLGGGAGRLFDRMLAAIGRSRADVHLAAVCAKRPMAGRLPRDATERLGEIARHHVALAVPKRLLVMGEATSRALLATDLSQARGRLHPLNHKDGTTTEAVATFAPRLLLERPAIKAEAWKDLQLLVKGLAS